MSIAGRGMSLWEIEANRNVAAIISQTPKTVSLVVTILKRVGEVCTYDCVLCLLGTTHISG